MAKILILNWRDPQSHLEGGAERFSQKYAEFWASQGHQVFWLTNLFPGAKKSQVISGVTYLRYGPILDGSLIKYLLFYPLFLLNAITKANQLIKQEKIDLVIDEIHGLPFFTPLFSQKRNVLLVCEVAGPIWDKMFPWPISQMGNWLEKFIYRLYNQTEIWVISKNTLTNVQQILPQANIKIVELGVEVPSNIKAILKIKKTPQPSGIFLARLVKMKGIETALITTAKVMQKIPSFKLVIIGKADGKYMKHLQQMIKHLRIEKNVIFLGFVSEEQKFMALRKAHFLLHPSYKEGFGLTVVEAGLVGTPAIVRSGSSLDELVKDQVSGFHFRDDRQLAKLITSNLSPPIYQPLAKNALKMAQNHTWTNILKNSITIS